MTTENHISKIVFESALKIHREIGLGLLESVYKDCLEYELLKNNLYTEREKEIQLIYDNQKIGPAFRADFMIEGKFIIEVKAVSELSNVHFAQILNYLKLSNCKLGALINFNVILLKDGYKRVINGQL